MKNYRGEMTALRRAIFDARLTQTKLAEDADVPQGALSLAATGRLPLGRTTASRIRSALAAHGVRVSLEDARGL